MKNTLSLLALLANTAAFAQYTGSGSVTQGLATTTTASIYTCTGGRTPGIGSIVATDNTTWTVPAVVNFTNSAFPSSSNLHNVCENAAYANTSAAVAALSGSDIITIDSTGQVITAFIFADNYFEMYVNGTPVGKDRVPYTDFNSSIVRFKVNYPFTVAMLLVDWEENLGLGSENNGGFTYYDGDGGMVAIFKDASGNVVDITDATWKAQTYYTAPITDLACPSENGTSRLSSGCSTQSTNTGSNYYALHWQRPLNWTMASFDDSTWPSASIYTNNTVGVNNKQSYTNFTDLFDDATNDAQFIWSTNLILDNEVIVRKTISTTPTLKTSELNKSLRLYPNPAQHEFSLDIDPSLNTSIQKIVLYNVYGEQVLVSRQYTGSISIQHLPKGVYLVQLQTTQGQFTQKLLIE